jgi:hypothetical protein
MIFAFQGRRYHADEDFITIIARDMEHGFQIFVEWFKTHRQGETCFGVDLRVLTDDYVYGQPEMRDLIEAGHTGVCYWHEERSAWTIAAPNLGFKGLLKRPTQVHGFVFHHGAWPAQWVFGGDLAEAYVIYDIWHRGEWGCPAEWDSITPLRLSMITPEKQTLLLDMETGLKGIAEECEGEEWRICSPERD